MNVEETLVEVRPHDTRWATLYRAESDAIRSVLRGYALAVEHFGSTAVPGLVAKPIVDILVGVDGGDRPREAIEGLGRLGYEYLGEDGRRPGRFFWRKRTAASFNVSVVPYEGALWRSNLAVRDFLISHSEWAESSWRARGSLSGVCSVIRTTSVSSSMSFARPLWRGLTELLPTRDRG